VPGSPKNQTASKTSHWRAEDRGVTRFPALEGKEVIAVLESFGFVIYRQKGSHVFMKHTSGRATVVPIHSGEMVGPGLFAKILRDVELKREDFLKDKKRKNKR
jgi:predicted RNA binding protein YcfA (HicA-like mRNA interferase family)